MTESILVHNSGVGFAPDIGRIIDTAGRNTGTQGHRNTANNVNLFYETNSEKIKINVFEIFGPFTILFWANSVSLKNSGSVTYNFIYGFLTPCQNLEKN